MAYLSDDDDSDLYSDSEVELASDNELCGYVDTLFDRDSIATLPIEPRTQPILGAVGLPDEKWFSTPQKYHAANLALEKPFLEDDKIYASNFNMPTAVPFDALSPPETLKETLHLKYDIRSLKNDLGLTGDTLKAFQTKLTGHTVSVAKQNLSDKSFGELCSFEVLQSIHEDIFKDIHPAVAGAPRKINMSRNNAVFSDHKDISINAETICSNMRSDTRLQPEEITPKSQQQFIEAMGEYYLGLYSTHSFRDGNTRSLGVLFDEIAERAGFKTLLLSLDSSYAKGDHRDQTLTAMTDPDAFPDFIDWLSEGIIYPASEAGAYPSYDQVEFDAFIEGVDNSYTEEGVDTEQLANIMEANAGRLSLAEIKGVMDKYGLDSPTESNDVLDQPNPEALEENKSFVRKEQARTKCVDISPNAGVLSIR